MNALIAALREEIEERRWMLTQAQLSHTPQSKESARASSRQFQKLSELLTKQEETLERLLLEIKNGEKQKKESKEIVSSFTVKLDPGEKIAGLS